MAAHDPKPRTDGLYRDGEQGDPMKWLRFYPDGHVIEVSTSPGSVRLIASWFRRGAQHVLAGAYVCKGGAVSFTTSTVIEGLMSTKDARGAQHLLPQRSTVAVDHEGHLEQDALVVSWYSHATQLRGTHRYRFHPLSEHDLDAKISLKRFRKLKRLADLALAGLSAAEVEAVKRAKSAPLLRLNSDSADELRERAGLPESVIARIVAWRDGDTV